jgi:hypothetical protein
MLNGNPGFALLAKKADDQIELELESASFGSTMTKKDGIFPEQESLDDFRRQIQQRTVPRLSSSAAQKWAELRAATRSLAALNRSSAADDVFQILNKVSTLLKAEDFPDQYELRILQMAWRVSRILQEKNVAALPDDEFQSLPARLRVIFDNAIIALNPQERSARIRRACDLADLYNSDDKQNSPSAEECLAALNDIVSVGTADDITPNEKEWIKKHFGADLRGQAGFPMDLFKEKYVNLPAVNAPVKRDTIPPASVH